VVISKKERSLKTIQEICVGQLDLLFGEPDIEGICQEGRAALQNHYLQGVQESLMLLAELLEMKPAPKAFSLKHHDTYGNVEQKAAGEIRFGPLVVYSMAHNSLACLDRTLSSRDKERLDRLKEMASGEFEATASGPAVFDWMKSRIISTS
jgi:hypothetical protein